MSNTIIKNSIKMLIPLVCALLFSSAAYAGSWRSQATIGGKLKVHVYVPTSSPALKGKRALMVSLHGCGQTHSDFKTGANWRGTADDYGMVVALPMASKEGSYGWVGCWNFHVGMNASRTKSDAKYLINMVKALISDTSLNIDPKQVYITGLSSGAGMTNQLACLAPDIFAGAGVNAGPAPGSKGDDLSSPGVSASQGKTNCNNLAGSYKSHLYTQVYNNVHGTKDGSVAPAHAQRNTAIFERVYEQSGGGISVCSTSSLSGGGDVTTLCDGIGPRISKVMVNGMEHAWPAGPGSSGGGNYIDHTHINYPDYITDFFFSNNRRINGGGGGTPTPTPTAPPSSCKSVKSTNKVHFNNKRATRNYVGYYVYYAKGSGQYLGGTYTSRRLYTTNGGSTWKKGSCP